ncbi:hypothetical protein AOLI_G00053900 [Acnodon oligacanthus]
MGCARFICSVSMRTGKNLPITISPTNYGCCYPTVTQELLGFTARDCVLLDTLLFILLSSFIMAPSVTLRMWADWDAVGRRLSRDDICCAECHTLSQEKQERHCAS